MSGRRRTVEELTVRQREITLLVVQGLSNKEIARQLNIAEDTVKIHLHQVYRQLGISNRTTLTAFAYGDRAD